MKGRIQIDIAIAICGAALDHPEFAVGKNSGDLRAKGIGGRVDEAVVQLGENDLAAPEGRAAGDSAPSLSTG